MYENFIRKPDRNEYVISNLGFKYYRPLKLWIPLKDISVFVLCIGRFTMNSRNSIHLLTDIENATQLVIV